MKDYGTKDKQALRWSTLDLLNAGHSGKELRTLLTLDGFDPELFHYIDRWEEEWSKFFFRPTKSGETPVK